MTRLRFLADTDPADLTWQDIDWIVQRAAAAEEKAARDAEADRLTAALRQMHEYAATRDARAKAELEAEVDVALARRAEQQAFERACRREQMGDEE